MKDLVKRITRIFVLITMLAVWLYSQIRSARLLTGVITLITMSYHFSMRCIVGFSIDKYLNNHVDYTKPWFQTKTWEKTLYDKLRVKKWKEHIPTFESDLFNPNVHSWEEIVQASCQAELVHETIALLSLVPLTFSRWFGSLSVFVITSVAAASVEMIFVIVQRYNRPRMLRIMNR